MSKIDTSTAMTEGIAALDWRAIAAALDLHGCAVVNGLVAPETCDALAKGYDDEDAFRSRVVMACAAAGLARPIDGPWLNLDDETGLEVSARHARRLGFGGKTAIHPRQLPAIRAAFAADADEVAWARRVVAAFEEAEGAGVGAVRLADGTFVDAPVADRARSILRASGATGGVAGG